MLFRLTVCNATPQAVAELHSNCTRLLPSRQALIVQEDSYYEGFMNHTHLGRCNFMKALHRAAPLEAAHAPLPVESPTTRLMVRLLVPLTQADTPLLMCFARDRRAVQCFSKAAQTGFTVFHAFITSSLTHSSLSIGNGGVVPYCPPDTLQTACRTG